MFSALNARRARRALPGSADDAGQALPVHRQVAAAHLGGVLGPHARDRCAAAGALALGGNVVRADEEAVPLDEGFLAAGAAGVFPGADLAGAVAGVDEVQPLLGADLGGADEHAAVGVGRVGHLVVAVEAGDVPGDVAADRRQEAGRAAQLLFAVVEAGDDQRDDLHPDAALVDHADAVQDVLQRAAQRAVVAVVEALQVDLVGPDPGAEVVEHLRGGVAVGDEAADQAGGGGVAEDLDGPLGGDQRLVVAGDDQARALAPGDGDQLLGGDAGGRDAGRIIT